jgi:hypothetical protein
MSAQLDLDDVVVGSKSELAINELAQLRAEVEERRKNFEIMCDRLIATEADNVQIRNRIAELTARTTWQPISSAPKDEKVLVCGSGEDPDYVGWAILMSDDDYWHEEDGFSLDSSDFPTHWMPLPSVPTKEPPK